MIHVEIYEQDLAALGLVCLGVLVFVSSIAAYPLYFRMVPVYTLAVFTVAAFFMVSGLSMLIKK